MLQIRNAEDGKSEWNVSEAHIIIPMLDGDLISNKESEKILSSAVTVNSLEGGDQAVLTNALEHSFVVGLDRNLFETTNYKSDLLIIQNTDLKLFPCTSDLKVAYTLPNVDQEKSELTWHNTVPKDRVCANEKTIFEVRHILNYDVDLEKTGPQLNLRNISNGNTSQAQKSDKEIPIQETSNQEKNVTESEFIVNYTPEPDNSKSVCILLNAEVPRPVENVKSTENSMKKPFQTQTNSQLNVLEPSYKLGDFEGVFNVTNHLVSCSDSSPVNAISCRTGKIDKNEEIMTKKNEVMKVFKEVGEWGDGKSDSLLEKNLPLKKKAKMKSMSENSEIQKSASEESAVTAQEHIKVPVRKRVKHTSSKYQSEEDSSSSDSEPLVNQRKKPRKRKTKLMNSHENSLVEEVKEDLKKADLFTGDKKRVRKFKLSEFDEAKFSSIYDLVECLQKCRLINKTVLQIIKSGLKEMKVDILKEMNAKRTESSLMSLDYSPQLKAFALVLHFKQPAAFQHLSQVYGSGWPTLSIIKEWKRQMNARHRRSVARVRLEAENSQS